MTNSELAVGQAFAERVRQSREARGWSKADLSRRLTEIGYPTHRVVLGKIEEGGTRAANVTIKEVLAFAAALDVDPIHLIVPLEDEATFFITKRLKLPAVLARKWIRGDLTVPLVTDGGDPRQLPRSELRDLVVSQLTRDVPKLYLDLTRETEGFNREADRITDEIRNSKENR